MRCWRPIAAAVCVVCGIAADARAQLKTSTHASGFSLPVAMVQDPTDSAVQFVVQQAGRIRVIRNGVILPSDFLNLGSSILCCGEQGLLGLAFAPDYATSRRFFVNFTNAAGHTVVARFKRSVSDPVIADPSTRFDLHWGGPGNPGFIVQPYANHNGGNLVFGPDGMLYIGMGDGGSANDPEHRAQTPTELLGKMLRIDVNVPDGHLFGYQIPPDNPFVSSGPAGTRPEIWAFGVRNPWKFSFDNPAFGGTGAMVIGDVGQNRFEEIDYEPANRGGRNYGWRNREAAHDNVTSLPPAYLPLVDPIHEYDHGIGQSVTGGYVYRGHDLSPAYGGRYFFADYVAGRVWSLGLTINSTTQEATVANIIEHTADLGGFSTLGNISAFGMDTAGELYIVSYTRGVILKVVDSQPVITVQPANQTVRAAQIAQFTVAATGVPAPAYQWQISTNGGSVWTNLTNGSPYSGVTTATLSVSARLTLNGMRYRAVATNSVGSATSNAALLTVFSNAAIDYEGDGKADLALYRPSNGTWYVKQSGANYTTAVIQGWGLSTDLPVKGDYDGDGKADLALYRPSSGTWYILLSITNYATAIVQPWGASADIPVPGDYDGDGKTDLGVYRPSTGTWYVLQSSTNYTTFLIQQWGASTDIAVPGDYDGDGRTDPAVFRPSTGTWYILRSTSNYTTFLQQSWGVGTDITVPGDYDGDGKTDPAVFRPSNGTWYVLRSTTNYTTAIVQPWGLNTDIAVPGDYDGDGRTDVAVFRPSTGAWFILESHSNNTTFLTQSWGTNGDIPAMQR